SRAADRVCDRQPAGARIVVHRARRRVVRRDGRRRELARQRSGRERVEAEEADEHACRVWRRARAPDSATAAVARAVARVHPRGRGGRGHAAVDSAQEGRTVSIEAANAGIAGQARAHGYSAGVISPGEVVPAAEVARMTGINLQDEFAEVVTTAEACA